MSLVPSVHNRIAISTGPFAQRPAPTTANPTEIFLLHLCDQFLQAECLGPSDNEIGDQLLMGNIEGGLAAVRVEGDQALARTSEAAKDGDHVFGCFATISDSLARRRVSSTPSLWRKRAHLWL